MTGRPSGALRIFLYNWPTYVCTWLGAAATLALASTVVPGPGALWLSVAAVAAALWSVSSLIVSHYVYDRSALAGGTWITDLVANTSGPWAAVDAGLDAEVSLDALTGPVVARLDIYDGALVRAPSVERARARTPRVHGAIASSATALALGDATCDLVAVVFTAHELRDAALRERFFAELHRVLRPGGTVLLVEHVRDLANFIAYGPGFLHFQPRSEWLRLANQTNFVVAKEATVTPFVVALALAKQPTDRKRAP